MESKQSNSKPCKAIIFAAVAALTGGTFANAATTPAPTAAPAAEGLAGLDDTALAAELSSRGLTSLLDHYFKVNHVSEPQQQAIKTFGALRELRNPGAAINVGEKMRRVKEVADGIDLVLPSLKDPAEMMSTAGALIDFGVKLDMNDIEYWGEDPITQAHLKPLADAVIKLLSDAAVTARKQADDLETRLKGGNDPNAERWDRLDKMAGGAAYGKEMAVYFAAAARSTKDPERKAMAEKAIAGLAEFDDDSHGVQPRVRNMIGNLLMVSGDFAKAKQTLATVIAGTGLTPAPNPIEINEARRFTVLCDLLGKDLAAARTDEAAMEAYQSGDMPKVLAETYKLTPAEIAAGAKSYAAGDMLLQWRIDVLEGELAKSPADKTKAEDAAEAVLAKLRQAHPELGYRIDQQLVKRMPADKKIDDKMAPSLLVALEKKGVNESYKTADEKPDPTVIKKGIEAAQAIVKRKGTPGLTPADVEEAQLSIANLHNFLGNKVEAANAFIDYADAYYPAPKATQAFDAAGYLVLNVMKGMGPNAPVGYADVYARFLPIAINKFGHFDLAYPYAEQLRGLKRYAEALKFYRMIPKTNPQLYSLAKYKEMMTLQSMLDDVDKKQVPAERKQTVAALLQVAEEVRKLSDPPKDDYDRDRALDAIATLADLYRRELNDPNRTLQVLDGYEKLVAGISDGKTPQEKAARTEQKASMIRGAIASRINAYMALGKSNEAVQQVTQLLASAKGSDGINFVKVLLAKLDKDYVNADLAHNLPVMKEAARNSALLTGYLVKYSDPATQKDPEVSKWYYAYAAYDGTAQRIAGSLADDPAERKKLLEAAADRFRLLQSEDMHKLYLAQPEVKAKIAAGLDPTEPDWQVQTGLAFADFDLGNYKDARDLLSPVIALKKLGTGSIESTDNGQVTMKPNDLYWEAYYKFLKSDYEVGATEPQARADAIKMLKNLLLLGGIPERWQDEFESLRKEAIPDFNPDHPVAQKAGTPATTQAASAAK